MPACLAACMPACLSACISACLPACLHVCVHDCMRVCLPACMSAVAGSLQRVKLQRQPALSADSGAGPQSRRRRCEYCSTLLLWLLPIFSKCRCEDPSLHARLPACLPACLLACLPACLPACMSTCMYACIPACLPTCLRACVHACPFHYQPACIMLSIITALHLGAARGQ